MTINQALFPLSENLFWVESPSKGRYPFCNGFLITGRETFLIDAGIGEELIKEIDAWRRIDCLIISHSHPDHFLFWHHLKDRRILMPRETPDSIVDLMALGIRFAGSPENAVHWKKRVADEFGLKPMRLPDGRFKDGDIIDAGGIKLEAIHAPGHLNDHYCFLVHDSGVLLSTDIDFESFGPWYGNPESDISRFKKSVLKISKLPYTRVCGSHKPPLEKAAAPAAFDRYYKIFRRHQQQVFDLCEKPSPLHTIIDASPFYRNKMPNKILQEIFEGRMIRKNLELLEREGLVEKPGGIYRQVP
jgi:glyoxylase-like metal-dependent hydrolase (beta-lactamase superfamily II)